MRRDFSRLIDLIKCSATLHQFQRETDEKGRIIATEQDYKIAKECINYIQKNTLKGLIHKLRKAYDCCLEMKDFTAKDIHATYPIVSLQMWYRYLDQLCEKEMLKTELRTKDGSDKNVTYYFIKQEGILVLPDFHELNELNEIISKSCKVEEDYQ